MGDLQGRTGEGRLPFASRAAVELHVLQLHPSLHHPRREYCDSDLESMADSLRQHGQLTPLWVRPLADDQYEIVAGVLRWRAAQLAGISHLTCQVFEVDDDQAFVLSLIENLQRCELTPLEEARAYQEMLDRSIARNRAAIARLLGVTRARITQRMKLLELDPATQRRMEEHPDLLTESHGRLLWEVEHLTERHALADDVIASHSSCGQLRDRVEEYQRAREVELWQLGDRARPRSYRVTQPGFSLHINFRLADLDRVVGSMSSLMRRLQLMANARDGRDERSAMRGVKPV